MYAKIKRATNIRTQKELLKESRKKNNPQKMKVLFYFERNLQSIVCLRGGIDWALGIVPFVRVPIRGKSIRRTMLRDM